MLMMMTIMMIMTMMTTTMMMKGKRKWWVRRMLLRRNLCFVGESELSLRTPACWTPAHNDDDDAYYVPQPARPRPMMMMMIHTNYFVPWLHLVQWLWFILCSTLRTTVQRCWSMDDMLLGGVSVYFICLWWVLPTEVIMWGWMMPPPPFYDKV